MNRRSASARPRPPDDVFFPVVPMLDMAFQLLAFFLLTFQAPSRETALALDLPVSPLALPRPMDAGRPLPEELSSPIVIDARATPEGGLESLRIGDRLLADVAALREALRSRDDRRSLRIALQIDDALHFDRASELLAACQEAGVAALRIVPMAEGGRR